MAEKTDSEKKIFVNALAESSLPMFANIAGPVVGKGRRRADSGPVMIKRRTSWSATSQKIERKLRRPFGNIGSRFGGRPIDPAIPAIPELDDSPSQPRSPPTTCTVQEILRFDEPKAEPEKLDLFPEFDSIEPYCIAEHSETSRELWYLEAKRITSHVSRLEIPLRYSNRKYFGVGDQANYKDLSRLADKILTAISICSLDNECINVQYCKSISNRARLAKWIEQAHVAGAVRDEGEGIDGLLSLDESEKRKQEQTALFDLLNYISAVLARLIIQTAGGRYWQATVLGALVKRITKIKILLLDLSSNAQVVAQHGETVIDQSREAEGNNQSILDDEEECEEALRMIDADAKDGLKSFEEAEVATYCINQKKYRSGMNSALKSIVMSLRHLNRSGLPVTTYEICGLVYETGFHGFKTLLHQNRDMEYSATSDLDNLNTADSAFRILNHTVEHLQATRKSSPPTNDSNKVVRTSIQWRYQIRETSPSGAGIDWREPSGPIELEFMDEIITVMVPLATTDPNLISELTNFRSIMLLSDENPDLVRPYKETDFSAFFRLFTSTIETSTRPQGVLRLSTAFRDGVFERYRLMSTSSISSLSLARPSDRSKIIQKFESCTRIMESEWVADETSIVVPGAFYVWSLAALACTLAAGGLAIGFTVGNRISGVDPFNIATYTWVLAAFIVLMCKSMLVAEWSWSDFLHSRVRCRSVSELEAVTGICAQLIIAKLLHDESGGGILTTKGPYNSMFLCRSDSGFSIDRPITTTTMLMSGLTPLKVITPRGEALVCLDARRGTQLQVVSHQATPGQKYLVCADVDRKLKLARSSTVVEKGKNERLQLLRSKDLKWKRVMGVYDAGNVVFV